MKKFTVEVPSNQVPCMLVNKEGKILQRFDNRQRLVETWEYNIDERVLAEILDNELMITENMMKNFHPTLLGSRILFIECE